MKYKVGDRVNVEDTSFSFGVNNDEYSSHIPNDGTQNLIVVETGLNVMRDADGNRTGTFFEQCDLLITDDNGNYWFTQSENCKSVDKEIKIRYFSDGRDVTNRISNEMKRNLKAL